MDELLNELLTLARQGEVVSDREAVDLRSVAESTWGNVATADARLSVPAEAHIDADPGRVKGVFENLYRRSRPSASGLDPEAVHRNSVEHAGHDVTVRVGTLDDGFYVEDDGPGIPPADRDRVFESGYTTAGDGTGFGLAIVAEIVEAHGWRIAAVEGRDGGSRFEIRAGDRPVLHES
jgi:signal transduction histidine kinase